MFHSVLGVCVCVVIGDNGGNAVNVCGVVSLVLWWPSMRLVGSGVCYWY